MKKTIFILTAFAFAAFSYCCSSDGKETEPGITAIELAGSNTLNLRPGESTPLSSLFEVSPSDAAFSLLSFTVANPSVAVVEGGNIRFVSNGQTTLKATADEGKITSQPITVICSTPATGISVSKDQIDLTPGESVDVSGFFSIEPENASLLDMEFIVEHTTVAVMEGTSIKFVNNGETTLKATADDGRIVSSTIAIVCSSPVTEVLALTGEVVLFEGEEIDVAGLFTVVPSTASIAELRYTIGNENVSKIQNGKLIYISDGSTTITAHATDGSDISSTPVTITCTTPTSDLSPKSQWTATASSYSDESEDAITYDIFTPYPSCVLDGEEGTHWLSKTYISSGGVADEWLLLDLGRLCDFRSVTITDIMGFTRVFDIYTSSENQPGVGADHSSFQKVGSGGISTSMTVNFGMQKARYIKIHITGILSSLISGATISDITVE